MEKCNIKLQYCSSDWNNYMKNATIKGLDIHLLRPKHFFAKVFLRVFFFEDRFIYVLLPMFQHNKYMIEDIKLIFYTEIYCC